MTRKSEIILSIVILMLAIVAYGGYVWWEHTSLEARKITEVQKTDSLKSNQIIKMLTSGDFKQKLQARRELSKLSPQEKKAVLLKMCKQKNAATRMMAVQGLKDYVKDPAVVKVLNGLAKDPDPDVAAQAKQVLGGVK